MNKLSLIASFLFAQGVDAQRGLEPADLIKKLTDEWTSYSADYGGKRYGYLTFIDATNVKNLSLKRMSSGITTGCGATGAQAGGADGGFGGAGFGGRGGGGGAPAPIIVGGLGTGDVNRCGAARLGGGILVVDGMIYASAPDIVWAIDARDGSVQWRYYWKTRGGASLQTRGLGMWHNFVYFELHGDWVVCLDGKTRQEVWQKEIAPFDQQYFSSNAPITGGGAGLNWGAYIDANDYKTGGRVAS
jgi:alcohol dehydrogenase (cytochrome c)